MNAAVPVERIVFRSGRTEIGAFRCPADHPEFRHAGGPIADHHVFVFPRSRVWIRHEGRRPFATDTRVVTLYNPGQVYERAPLDDLGDFCDWFAVDAETARAAVAALDPSVEDRPDTSCFAFTHASSDARTYLAQRELFGVVSRGEAGDALGVEERVIGLLDRVLESAYRVRRLRRRAAGDEIEAVRAAQLLLAERFSDALSLEAVARAVGLSRYRLCHVFREATGATLHGHREELRLRAALEALEDRAVDLTELALQLGYSSHSHFTSRFRRAFGVAPSRLRGRLFAADRADGVDARRAPRGHGRGH